MAIFKKINDSISFLYLLLFLTVCFSSQVTASDEELGPEALGIAFVNATAKRDTATMGNLFNYEAFVEKTASLVFTDDGDITDFKRGFLSNIPTSSAFMDQVMSELFKEQFIVKYLDVVDGRPLIRFDYVSGGHEYLFLLPQKTNSKSSVADDLFFLSRGKAYSKVVADVSQMAIKPSASVLKRLFDMKDIDTKLTQSVSHIMELTAESKYQEAYDQLGMLPEDVKRSRFMLDTAVQLSGHLSDDEYEKQLGRLEKHYGNDPTTSFSLIDYHFLKKDFAKAVKAVGVMQLNLGNDAALESLVASIYFEAGEIALAKQHAMKAIEIESDFENAYWILVNTTNSTKTYDETVAALEDLQSLFGYEFTAEDFAAEPSYAELTNSKVFNEWLNQ